VNLKFRAPFSTAVAISTGLIVLLGFFFGVSATGETTLLGVIRDYFLQGVVVLASIALLVGVGNLMSVHRKKIQNGEEGSFSIILLGSLILTLLVGIYDMVRTYISGESHFRITRWIFDYIQVPIETALMAILAVSLTYAVARLLGRRLSILSGVFAIVVLILLVGTVPLFTVNLPLIGEIRAWIVSVPALGGARGILLGIALGTIATGLRILMGSDRPYGG
jgi:hypothetical protein